MSEAAAPTTGEPAPYATGLIVGRFDPPHLGHSYMIDSARGRCDRLVVFVNSSTIRDAVPGTLRANWLAELHPGVQVREIGHRLATDFDDEALWVRWMELFRRHWPYDTGPDVVFSSDGYVVELARRFGAAAEVRRVEPPDDQPRRVRRRLARRFGAAAEVVDAERRSVPVSATMIRDDPAEHLDRVADPVRRWIEENWLCSRTATGPRQDRRRGRM